MKGDFSRNTFDRAHQYIGVRWQQGRPTTDADENEAQDILVGRIETADLDTIGAAGAPKVNPGFALSFNEDGQLEIGAGHFYVDGILVENETPIMYEAQPNFPNVIPFPNILGNAETGLVMLEVFKRHLTFQDNPAISDVALNGVDTTTRLQTVWRVHILPLDSVNVGERAAARMRELLSEIRTIDRQLEGNPENSAELLRRRVRTQRALDLVAEGAGLSCGGDYPEWTGATALSHGRLTVTTVPGDTDEDLCNVPETGGYTRGENQFYRVEVHSVPDDGGRDGATFKFSRDNGSIVALIGAVGSTTSGSGSGTVFDVDNVQRDDYLGIFVDDWVEYVDDTHELNGTAGVLARVTAADTNLNRITLDRNVTINLDRHPKLRKWDQVAPLATDTGVAMNTTDTPIQIEGGIQLEFSDGTYRSGDYWQFAARAADATLDFPSGAQLPDGVQRHYARLGILMMQTRDGDDRRPQVLRDCRDLFPPLTDITADDVSFDNTICQLPNNVQTVQDAIEALCARSSDADDGIHVNEIRLVANNAPLRHDSELDVDLFVRGIRVVCDQDLFEEVLTRRPTYFITLDIPFPMMPAERSFWSPTVIGYQPLILSGNIDPRAGNQIDWYPTRQVREWLQQRLFSIVREYNRSTHEPIPERILAHLTLKGNFIWSRSNPDLYLDGEVFGTVNLQQFPSGVRLPSGNGRRGGDLELWFWLVNPQIVEIPSLGLFYNLDSVLRTVALQEGLSFAIDPESIRGPLEGSGFTVNTNRRFDPIEARRRMGRVRNAAMSILAEERHAEVTRAVAENIRANIGVADVTFEFVPDFQSLRDQLSVRLAAGNPPLLVIADMNADDELGQMTNSVFGPGVMRL